VPYWDIDTGFAALLMLLTVVDAGLGACFFGITPERIPGFRDAFSIPEALTPIGALSIGFRAQDTPSPSIANRRRAAADVIHHGRW
jgi:nitroreductase